MGSKIQERFICDRCGIDVTLPRGEQPARWSAVTMTRPPLATFESGRLLMCDYCTEQFTEFWAAPGDAQIAAVFGSVAPEPAAGNPDASMGLRCVHHGDGSIDTYGPAR